MFARARTYTAYQILDGPKVTCRVLPLSAYGSRLAARYWWAFGRKLDNCAYTRVKRQVAPRFSNTYGVSAALAFILTTSKDAIANFFLPSGSRRWVC